MHSFSTNSKMFSWIMIIVIASLFISYSQAQTCSSHAFSNTNRLYTNCNDLPVLNSILHWTYHQPNHTVDIAFRHTDITDTTWVAWALNLEATTMIGSQSLVAYHNTSGAVLAHTSPITVYSTQLQPGPLSFEVPNIEAEFNNNEMTIYATLVLPSGQTSFNQVWQSGPVSDGVPKIHELSGENVRSMGTVDFLSGQTSATSGNSVNSLRKRRNAHGILNVVSWGILMPIGAITARYLKVFKSANPAWFYIHVTCQTSAYIVGVAGWGTGLKLGSDSVGIKQNHHRNLGIVLFCLGTLQIFALLLRPKPEHKYRFYWNIYHHVTGYTVIILSIVNIFEGFDILLPAEKWKRAYIGVIIFLGIVAGLLEAITWGVVLKRKKTDASKSENVGNGVVHQGA